MTKKIHNLFCNALMTTVMIIAIIVIVIAVLFDFSNGFHDAANIVATIISSRSMSPETALIIASICEFAGPLLFGTAVAAMIGKGLVEPSDINVWIILAAISAAIIWNLMTWWLGLPSSSSHALIGGIAGAVIAGTGFTKLKIAGFSKVILVLITSPILGLVVGFVVLKLILYLCRGQSPKINNFFKKSQLVTASAMALSHGANDAQKTMGIITIVLTMSGLSENTGQFHVPLWVVLTCATAISLGTATGGWSIIKTVGSGIYKLRPVHGFSVQLSSALIIFLSAHFGFPVSTTHIASSSIMGVGSAERIKAVKWHKAGEIVMTWFLTIPASGVVAALIYGMISVLRNNF